MVSVKKIVMVTLVAVTIKKLFVYDIFFSFVFKLSFCYHIKYNIFCTY